jgi:hypothetical protein
MRNIQLATLKYVVRSMAVKHRMSVLCIKRDYVAHILFSRSAVNDYHLFDNDLLLGSPENQHALNCRVHKHTTVELLRRTSLNLFSKSKLFNQTFSTKLWWINQLNIFGPANETFGSINQILQPNLSTKIIWFGQPNLFREWCSIKPPYSVCH